MALNQPLYTAIPHVRAPGAQRAPAPPPSKAHAPHAYGFLDGRKMAGALDGVTWGSLRVLEGYARTMRAGAVAPTEARGGALVGLYPAC